MENDINTARAAGFSEHLTKPINFERLEECDSEDPGARSQQPRSDGSANGS